MLWLAAGFVGNGFAQFLQKYLHAAGLGHYQASALIAMYATGSLFALALLAGFQGRLRGIEFASGLGIGLCSYLGNFAVLRALGDLPAYTVFPVVVGGPIILVALYSWLIMGERRSWQARAGIGCGLVAVVLLTL
jgi:drug/metabolite transporter (DMT)-like permease